MTTEPAGSNINVRSLTEIIGEPSGDWIVYYVRPNEDVFYTRTAGALMTPLSIAEYDKRRRVKDIMTV